MNILERGTLWASTNVRKHKMRNGKMITIVTGNLGGVA